MPERSAYRSPLAHWFTQLYRRANEDMRLGLAKALMQARQNQTISGPVMKHIVILTCFYIADADGVFSKVVKSLPQGSVKTELDAVVSEARSRSPDVPRGMMTTPSEPGDEEGRLRPERLPEE